MTKPKSSDDKVIAYFVTEDWYFCSHRLELAVAAKEAGYKVYVITRVKDHGKVIQSAGLELVPVNLSRRSKNPISAILFIMKLAGIYRRIEPDIVHHVAMKPVILGSIAARLARLTRVVNALAGLGFIFSSDSALARTIRPITRSLLWFILNSDKSTTIFQNPDDMNLLIDSGIVSRDRVRLILGSGVDVAKFERREEPGGQLVVLLASRMLWDKGVGEFVEAATLLKKEGVKARFVLAGETDVENPGRICTGTLQKWNEQGNVEWLGKCDNMPDMFAEAHIVCLPTRYGEGVPKVLIEAASCGRPIVASDAPGCREIVQDNYNGLLVPQGRIPELACAIRRLLESPELRLRMGECGRNLVESKFSLDIVLRETLALYDAVIQ